MLRVLVHSDDMGSPVSNFQMPELVAGAVRFGVRVYSHIECFLIGLSIN